MSTAEPRGNGVETVSTAAAEQFSQHAGLGTASPPDARAREQHAARRERFLALLEGGVAVLPAAPLLVQGRDTELSYRPAASLFYLTGWREPETVAVFTPHDPAHRFTLFVRPRDPERERWTGVRAGTEGAREIWGADAAYPLAELDSRLPGLLEPAERVWYALGTDTAIDAKVARLMAQLRHGRARSGRGPSAVDDPERLLGAMRLRKEPWEVEQIRDAARITIAGHQRAIAACRPGVGEWELEAALLGSFRGAGADGPSFPPIIGAGANAATLHYITNSSRVQADDLVLVDAGAQLGMYCADVTRTFPASGHFSPAQRDLYEVVLAAHAAACAVARPGRTIQEVHDAALDVLVEGMTSLGLLQGAPEQLIEQGAHKAFYPHQTSHWLGLDVHDLGPYRTPGGGPLPLEPGMVFTVEPGLYIPSRSEGVPPALAGIGVRLEDNLLVTTGDPEILTRDLPLDPDAIAALVGHG